MAQSQSAILRPEVEGLLRHGKAELIAAMSDTPQVLRRGDILVQSEKPHDFVYVIVSGWFSRNRTIPDGRRQGIFIFLPDAVCGIKSIFMTHQQDAIEALTPASVRRIHHTEARALSVKNSAVAMYLTWRFAQDERYLHNWNVRLGRADGEERLAVLLLELRTRLMARGVNDAARRYRFPLTRRQLADHLGLTPVHVGRILRRFREQKMVAIQRREVVFLENMKELEETARPVLDLLGSDSADG